jgi:hypothetical protein
VSDLPNRVSFTITFLRMAATQMRELAQGTPEVARELGQIADQLHAEADSLARHIGAYRSSGAALSR